MTMADIKEKYDMYQYNVNHDAEWLVGVCRSMITPFGPAKDREFEKGWDMCLHCVITIIEEGMIPQEGNEKCAECVHCEVCSFIDSDTAKAGACDFYDAGHTGHWIYSKAVNTGEIIFSECSACGHGESRCAKRMNYCPNCGARMAESEE